MRPALRVTLPLLALLASCDSDFSVTKTAGSLAVNPEVTDLGQVAVGGHVAFSIRIDNLSAIEVYVGGLDVQVGLGSGFSCAPEPFTIPADGNAYVPCTFAPEEVGYQWATIRVLSDALEPEEEVIARGRAVEAFLDARPLLLDFGPVAPGDSGNATLFLTASGADALLLSEALIDDARFEVADTLPVTLPDLVEVTLALLFTPRDTRPVEALLTLVADPFTVEVTLRGNDCERGLPELYDADGDGFATCGGDCVDANAQVRPGAPELLDGLDNDCDGVIDEGTAAFDDDGDGFSENDGDCNDADPAVSPAAEENYANGVDDDCDGVVDSGSIDDDRDGFAIEGGDCDDRNANVWPGAPELEDGLDNDCDGIVDEGTDAFDDDRDGYTEHGGDCDDSSATTHPGAVEREDWLDNDCDGAVDEGTRNYDDDGDGFTENGGDCNDANASVNPGAAEIRGNSVDENCNGSLTT